jgi:nucleoside-diphosphate-sugar epimerase
VPALKDLSGKMVLVTGGAGFIGSHLVDALLKSGAEVRVLDNLSTGREENLAHCRKAIHFFNGDLRDVEACHAACHGVDFVLHQAALGSVPRSLSDPSTSIAVNVTGTANLFSAAQRAGVSRVVYASSSSVFGDSDRLPKIEGEEGQCLSPYALSKKMNEDLAQIFGRCYEMEFIGLRYFNVYGPRQSAKGPYAAVIPRFVDAMAQGKSATIYGDGQQSRDFTYVADAVAANLGALAAKKEAVGKAYNIGAGESTTLLDLHEALARHFPDAKSPIHESARPGDVRHSQASIERAQAAFGYDPEVDVDVGTRRLVAALSQEQIA